MLSHFAGDVGDDAGDGLYQLNPDETETAKVRTLHKPSLVRRADKMSAELKERDAACVL